MVNKSFNLATSEKFNKNKLFGLNPEAFNKHDKMSGNDIQNNKNVESK